MELDKFKAQVTPAKRRSKLDKFLKEIFTLREDGYTLQQICEFLEANGTKVSRQSLHEFIQRRQGSLPKDTADQKPQTAAQAAKSDVVKKQATPEKPEGEETLSKAERLRRQLAEQQAAQEATQFKRNIK